MTDLRTALEALVEATETLLFVSETPLHDGMQMASEWMGALHAMNAARTALAAAYREDK